MKSILYILIVSFILIYSCNLTKNMSENYDEKHNKDKIKAQIDSVSISEIKQHIKDTNKTIYDYYDIETEDEVSIWSQKMFGRCCSEADLSYSELLSFEISTNLKNKENLTANLYDTKYKTSFAFNEEDNLEIYISLKKNSDYHKYHTTLEVNNVLLPSDTIIKPFRMSIVNGNLKSASSFEDYSRIRSMKVFLNNEYKSTVLLLDTSMVQEFELDITFKRDDSLKIIPISYYRGVKNDSVFISEIQSNLGYIAHPSINRKYKVHELYNQN